MASKPVPRRNLDNPVEGGDLAVDKKGVVCAAAVRDRASLTLESASVSPDEALRSASASPAEEMLSIEAGNLFDFDEFNGDYKKLMKDFGKLETLKKNEREEFVLRIARQLRTLRFLLFELRESYNIQIIDGNEIYKQEGRGEINLTEAENYFATVEDKERSFYEELENKRDTITARDFLKLSLGDRLRLVSNIKSWEHLKKNALIVFDFGENEALEYQIGLGDFMPSWIRSMSINGNIYERRGNQGFYCNGKYLPIFNGTRVTITRVDEKYSAAAEYSSKFGDSYESSDEKVQYRGEEEFEREITKKDILGAAQDFSIDAHFLEAVVAVIEQDFENDISDEYEFLHIAARYIQNAEAGYPGTFIENGHYNVGFVMYALDRFNLFAEYNSCSEKTVKAVIERYSEIAGLNLKYDEIIKEERRAMIQQAPEGMYHELTSVTGFGIEMIDNPGWKDKLYNELVAGGIDPEQARMNVLYTEQIYLRMRNRMGEAYRQPVTIRSYNGHSLTITNSCVGATMKAVEGLPIVVQHGKQAGRKYASNFYWGDKEPYLESLVRDPSQVIRRRINPHDVDSIVGQDLAIGECAVAALWDHSFWIYRRIDGTIMMLHSGADVRPRRISVQSVNEMPYGYERRGNYYVKIKGSKVNEVPLDYFLDKMRTKYERNNELRFVPMRTLVSANLSGSMAHQFRAYYERNLA